MEASPVDAIWVWGIGLAEKDNGVNDPARRKGENKLGFALLEARARVLS